MFWIVLMCWSKNNFKKIKKYIILMHFSMKGILKSNCNYTLKHVPRYQNVWLKNFLFIYLDF
jgi:hypothetical protein